MYCVRCVVLVSGVLLAMLNTAVPELRGAELRATAVKPYKRIAVTIPKTAPDPRFQAFRKQLVEIAKRHDRAALARLVVPASFFWERDVGGVFNPKKSSIDNLASAVRLNAADGRGWDNLILFANEPSFGPLNFHPNILCGPPDPTYSDAELDGLMDATGSDLIDWSYPRVPGLPVRATPDPASPAIETLGVELIRVLGYDHTASASTDPRAAAWARVATPHGRTGFVPSAMLLSPVANRLCYGRDGAGNWHIVGYVGGSD